MDGLRVENITRSFGSVAAVSDVTFDVPRGQVIALLGPSGCGKSTLLQVIAGLEPPDRGTVYWDGEPVNGMPPHLRGFGLMFQDFALFPHLNVFENVAFGLRMAGMHKSRLDEQVAQSLALVGLPGFDRRDVNNLSGGEQQRVALARSLAPRPRLLMLDEPLGSLDRSLRERLVLDLAGILHGSRQTAIYVTHDQEEAFALADQVAVMHAGRIEQIDSPRMIFDRPANAFVAGFLGLNNLIKATAVEIDGAWFAETSLGRLPLPGPARGPVILLLRPDAVADIPGAVTIQGNIIRRIFRGNTCQVSLQAGEHVLTFELPRGTDTPEDSNRISLPLDPGRGIQIIEKA